MEFIKRNIQKITRNGDVYTGNIQSTVSSVNVGSLSNLAYLPATTTDQLTYNVNHLVNFTRTNDDGTTTNLLEITNDGIIVNGNILSTGEISAYGAGESGGGSGGAIPYDGLDSTSTELALSANQGRVLKSLIDNIDVGDIDLSGYYSKAEIDNTLKGYSKTDHTHTVFADKEHTHSQYVDTTSIQTIKGNKTFDDSILINNGNSILDSNSYGVLGVYPTGWTGLPSDGKAIGLGTGTVPIYIRTDGNIYHYIKGDNQSYTVLDTKNYSTYATPISHSTDTTKHITPTERSNWNSVYNNWNNVFTVDSNGDLKVKVNVIGEKEISAWGAGTSTGGGGSITIVDGLTSTATDAALSANQGRVLKQLIDNIGNVDLSGIYTKTEVNNLLDNKIGTSNTAATFITSNQTGVMNFKSTNTGVGIRLYINDDNKGGLWASSDNRLYMYNAYNAAEIGTLGDKTPYYSNGSYIYTIYHTGNLTPSNYLPKAGGILTGAITMPNTTSSATIQFNAGEYFDGYGNFRFAYSAANTSSWQVFKGTNSLFKVGADGVVNVLKDKLIVAQDFGIYSAGGVLIANVSNTNKASWEGLANTTAGGIAIANSAYPSVIRTSGNNLYHFRGDKAQNYNILDSSNYADYTVPKVGGTFSGNLTIAAPTTTPYGANLIVQRTPSVMQFNDVDGNRLGYLGFSAADEPCMYGSTGGSDTVKGLLHTGGGQTITSHSTGLYINRTGTGNPHICFKSDGTNVGDYGFTSTGIPQYYDYTNKSWVNLIHSNNIGSSKAGSAGDSDMLQGYTLRGSSYNDKRIECKISYYLDLSALSASNFYPVTFTGSAKALQCDIMSVGGSASLAYNQNQLSFTFCGQGWNDTPQNLTVHYYNCYSATETTIGCIAMGTEGGAKCVWLRGGQKYYVASNIAPTLRTANYSNGNEIFTIGTNFYGGTNTKVTTYWTPQTTSGLGTMYHSAGMVLGGGLTVTGSAAIKGTLTSTGKITGSNGATITGTIDTNSLKAANLTYNAGTNAYLSSAGWYRIATSNVANNVGGTYIFSIRRDYYNHNNEAYIIAATLDFSGCYFTQLAGHYNTQLLTTFRCTYDNNGTAYFDVYYSGTVQNGVYINGIGNMTLQTPTKVTSELAITKQTSLTEGTKQGSTGAYPITLYRNNSSGGVYIMYGAANQLTKTWAAGSDSAHRFGWYYKDTSQGIDVEKMWLDSSGNLTCTGEVTAYSDIRLKTNIKPLEVRGELNPVTYEKDGKQSIGFIANEVQEIYPELVNESDEYLSLNYAQLTAVLAAEIKELRKEINELKNKIQ